MTTRSTSRVLEPTRRRSTNPGSVRRELNGDTLVRADATTFEAVRGATTTLDASLARGAVISVRAADAKTGLPISGACPAAYRGHAGRYARWQVGGCSAAGGAWTVRGLRASEFPMRFDADLWPAARISGSVVHVDGTPP